MPYKSGATRCTQPHLRATIVERNSFRFRRLRPQTYDFADYCRIHRENLYSLRGHKEYSTAERHFKKGSNLVLTSGKEKRIAVYLPATAEYSRRLATGVHQFCNEHAGLLWRDFWFAPEVGYVDATRGDPPWLPWKPDGLIAHAGRPEVDVKWLKTGVPHVVTTTSDCAADMMPVVQVDRRSIVRLALKHFQELGRTHFACVGLEQYRAGLIRQFFEEELARHRHSLQCYDLSINPGHGLNYQQDAIAKEPALLDFLRTADKPLALLASTDAVAREVCDACFAVGLSVPDDVAVLGLGNTIMAESTVPSLSSIDPPGEDVGYQATALLNKLLQGEPPPAGPVLVAATKLVVRQSTVGFAPQSRRAAGAATGARACRAGNARGRLGAGSWPSRAVIWSRSFPACWGTRRARKSAASACKPRKTCCVAPITRSPKSPACWVSSGPAISASSFASTSACRRGPTGSPNVRRRSEAG